LRPSGRGRPTRRWRPGWTTPYPAAGVAILCGEVTRGSGGRASCMPLNAFEAGRMPAPPMRPATSPQSFAPPTVARPPFALTPRASSFNMHWAYINLSDSTLPERT